MGWDDEKGGRCGKERKGCGVAGGVEGEVMGWVGVKECVPWMGGGGEREDLKPKKKKVSYAD